MSRGRPRAVIRDDGRRYRSAKAAALDMMREWGVAADIGTAYTMGSNIGKAARGVTRTAYGHEWWAL